VRTLIVSDLHLGAHDGVDLLRNAQVRAALLDALSDADRLVLAGDVLELRDGPRRNAVAAARDFFADLGRVMAGREVIMLAGNHDHELIEGWLSSRAQREQPRPLVSEQRFEVGQASPALAQLAEWAAPARVSCAYPGLWLRPDVYVTHGHYLDCHFTIPTIERLALGAMMRVVHRAPSELRGADDYEAVAGPLFAWIDAVAQAAPTGGTLNGQVTVRAWRALRPGKRGRTPMNRLIAGAFPLAVAAANRAGFGPLRADVSRSELRRAGLRAMGEVASRLDLGAGHVVFGHTHRAGPLTHDMIGEWSAPGGARLVNCGCWTWDRWFVSDAPQTSPYWPGGCVAVQNEGPPVLLRLLEHHSGADLAAATAAN
jgi:hypothetical protein